jgi:hypothetical protein
VDADGGHTTTVGKVYSRYPLGFDPSAARVVTGDGRVWRIVGTGMDVWATAGRFGGAVLEVETKRPTWNAQVRVETAPANHRDPLGASVNDWVTVWEGPGRVLRHDLQAVGSASPDGSIQTVRFRAWLPWRCLPPDGQPCRVRVVSAEDPVSVGALVGVDWRDWDDLTGCRRVEAKGIEPDAR